jgi:alpha-1,6-mannosyltransferase
VVTWLLLLVLRGRLHPVGGLGVALGLTVLLFPVVQPWYVLWAVIPLAAWATRPAFRTTTIVVTLVVGIFGPTANGDRFTLFQILLAVVASTVIALLLIALTHNHLPWRSMPTEDTADTDDLAAAPPGEQPSPPPTPPVKPDAYAESP